MKNLSKSKETPQGSWLENTIANTDSDESKLKAMVLICRRIKKDKVILKIPCLIFRLLFLLTSFTTFWGIAMLFSSPEEKAVINTLPEAARNALQIFEKCFHVFYDAFVGLLNGYDLNLPADKISIISSVATGVVLIFILTPLISRLTRFVLRKLPDGKSAKIPSKWSDTRTAASDTYTKLAKYNKGSNYSTWPVSIVLTVVVALLVAYAAKAYMSVSYLIGSFVCFLVFQLVGVFPKWIASKNNSKSLALSSNDKNTFEKYWCGFDPQKKEELERLAREEEQRRKREREEKERRELEQKKRPTITFDATGAHYANEFTVYLDGRKECSFSGGRRKSITVSPGYHQVQVQVYNDAAESAYTLAPMNQYFEEYGEYTVDYN